MAKVAFVIGANCTGKSWFVDHFYTREGVQTLDIYDFQQQVYGDKLVLEDQFFRQAAHSYRRKLDPGGAGDLAAYPDRAGEFAGGMTRKHCGVS